MERNHYKVLKTMQERMGFSKQAIKSIRGQLFGMTDAETVEFYDFSHSV